MRVFALACAGLALAACDQMQTQPPANRPAPAPVSQPASPAPTEPAPAAAEPAPVDPIVAQPDAAAGFATLDASKWQASEGVTVSAAADGGVRIAFTGPRQSAFIQNAEAPVAAGDTVAARGSMTAEAEGEVLVQIVRACGSTEAENSNKRVPLTIGANAFEVSHTFANAHGCARFAVRSNAEGAAVVTITELAFPG